MTMPLTPTDSAEPTALMLLVEPATLRSRLTPSTLLLLLTARRYNLNLTEMLIERHKRKQAQRREYARNQVLELLSRGAPLGEILEDLPRQV